MDKMGAQACLHTDDAAWKSLEIVGQRETLNLPAENHLAGTIKANEVRHILTDINADGKMSRVSEYDVVVFDLYSLSVQVKVSAD